MKDAPTLREFGIKRENEERRDGGCAVVFDPKTQRYAVNRIVEKERFWLFSGGVEANEDIKDGVLREVAEESGLYNFKHVEKIASAMTHYHNSLKNVNRVAHATCFLAILENTDLHPTKFEAHEKFILVWTTAADVMKNLHDNNENGDRDHWIYFFAESVNRAIALGYDTTSKKF